MLFPHHLSESDKVVSALVRKSHDAPMDFHKTVNWALGADRSRPGKKFETVWGYGSPYWDALTDEQRIEVSWLETARDVSVFINLEKILPELLGSYTKRYYESLAPEVEEYLMIFAKEEIMHILTFRRYLAAAGLRQHPPIKYFYDLADVLRESPPEVGLIFTLLIEWCAEEKAIQGSQHDEVDALTREMYWAHHMDEARHIAFGRHVAERYFERTPAAQTAELRGKLKEMVLRIMHAVPDIAPYASFALPIDLADDEAVNAVRQTPHYQSQIEDRYGSILKWCGKVGIMA
ncbi:MAG: diiron oxygenase [Hyphomicrobiales bacterium]